MRTLVIAPHPDDEILGCGGTLLRRKAEGVKLGSLIVTGISKQVGWSAVRVRQRDAEIARVAKLVGFSEVLNLMRCFCRIVRRVLAYETISETGFGLDADRTFYPNVFIDISNFLECKLEVMVIYQSELGTIPFPRSI